MDALNKQNEDHQNEVRLFHIISDVPNTELLILSKCIYGVDCAQKNVHDSKTTQRVNTDSRLEAVTISVDSVYDTLESGVMGEVGSEVGSEVGTETGDSVVAAPSKASVIRKEPVNAHQGSTTMSSIRDSKDETPSTCTHSRSEDLV